MNKKNIIKILLCILLVIVILIIIKNVNKMKNVNKNNKPVNFIDEQEEIKENEGIVFNMESNAISKSNITLNEKEIIKSIEISNIRIDSNKGDTSILADFKNISENISEEMTIAIKLYDANRNEVCKIENVILKSIEPGTEGTIELCTTKECSNVASFKLE